jgi:hypothetical protein
MRYSMKVNPPRILSTNQRDSSPDTPEIPETDKDIKKCWVCSSTTHVFERHNWICVEPDCGDHAVHREDISSDPVFECCRHFDSLDYGHPLQKWSNGHIGPYCHVDRHIGEQSKLTGLCKECNLYICNHRACKHDCVSETNQETEGTETDSETEDT